MDVSVPNPIMLVVDHPMPKLQVMTQEVLALTVVDAPVVLQHQALTIQTEQKTPFASQTLLQHASQQLLNLQVLTLTILIE